MRRVVAVEQIYDAAFDDEALRGLAVDLAAALDARSALIHWIHDDGSADVLAHSGYFTDDQLALYGQEFAAIDPWVGATAAPQFTNRVLDLEELVPVPLFAASDFYNDYVRRMGDDTGRCIGVRLQNGHGSGFIALQRGISQAGFEATTVARLQHYSGHLMRMLAMRGRLVEALRSTNELAALVNALGQAAILVDISLRVRQANHAAETLLESSSIVSVANGVLRASNLAAERQLSEAVAKSLAGPGGTAAAVQLRRSEDAILNVSVTSVQSPGGGRLALLLVSEVSAPDPTRVERLRLLYGLSPSEADIALMLNEGMQPADIAEQRRVSTETVRLQIKQIAYKLGCRRQAEIVRIVSSLPALHPPPTSGKA